MTAVSRVPSAVSLLLQDRALGDIITSVSSAQENLDLDCNLKWDSEFLFPREELLVLLFFIYYCDIVENLKT